MTATDAHQHLWPERLLSALAARRHPPRLVRTTAGWELLLDAESPSRFSASAHDPERRAALVAADGLDRALIAVSSPLGIEALPAAEAETLLDAHHEGVRSLGGPFGWWGAVGLDALEPRAADALVAAGADGISVPAGALATRRGLERVAPLLERVAALDVPLLVHPGPAPWRPMPHTAREAPAWWPALTTYVTQLHEAWHAFLAWGRADHPRLTVVWSMLAGGAPLHAERLAARGGPGVRDPRAYYDVSSYGPAAIEAMAATVGLDRLVYGSDRPVVAPPALPAALAATLRTGGPFAAVEAVAA